MTASIEPSDAPYHHRLVVGYHGCERKHGEAVLLGKARLEPSANDHDWLGGGIYFWEHGFRRALEWAQEHRKDPFVLGAYLHLGRCLDLTDTWLTCAIGCLLVGLLVRAGVEPLGSIRVAIPEESMQPAGEGEPGGGESEEDQRDHGVEGRLVEHRVFVQGVAEQPHARGGDDPCRDAARELVNGARSDGGDGDQAAEDAEPAEDEAVGLDPPPPT